jgi:L-threonylcarbamoyladenylate synthase
VLDKTDQVPEVVTGGQSSVALRFPSHPIARDLLSKFGGGVVGPSANKFGRLSPTQPKDVLSDLGGDIDLVLDGGACTVGIESTIVGFDGNTPVLLRPGMITTEEISSVLSVSVELAGERAPRVSGSLPSHYAPNTPLILVKPNLLKSEIERRLSKNDRIAVLAFSDLSSFADQLHYAEVSSDAKVYARTLYHELRELDQKKCDVILVEEVPMTNPWSGIRDRLLRAACR